MGLSSITVSRRPASSTSCRSRASGPYDQGASAAWRRQSAYLRGSTPTASSTPICRSCAQVIEPRLERGSAMRSTVALHGQEAAVRDDAAAGDVAGGVRDEEGDDVADLLDGSDPPSAFAPRTRSRNPAASAVFIPSRSRASIGVSIVPGAIAFTWIPCRRPRRRARVAATSPAFVAP